MGSAENDLGFALRQRQCRQAVDPNWIVLDCRRRRGGLIDNISDTFHKHRPPPYPFSSLLQSDTPKQHR